MQRVADLMLAVVLLPFILPVIGFIALTIIVIDRFSPFYLQERAGKNGASFTCIKFRAMKSAETQADVNDKVKDAKRVTQLGAWLRNRGLDELPQILNILSGEMSFVGPRPLLDKNIKSIKKQNPGLLEEIIEWEEKRSLVRPGISGWHQIHSLGPYILKYDLEYLEHPSLAKKIRIFLASIIIIIVGKRRYFRRS